MRNAAPHSHHSRRSIFRKFSRDTVASVFLGSLEFDLISRNHHWLAIQCIRSRLAKRLLISGVFRIADPPGDPCILRTI